MRADLALAVQQLLKMLEALPFGERVLNCELRTLTLEWSDGGGGGAADAPPCRLLDAKPPAGPDPARLEALLRARGVTSKR
eukprot:SAG22_NODE_4292_length_1315_cov_2.186678_2_plen_81_part_00